MGGKFFADFKRYCRVDAGYAALADVGTKQKDDRMDSFLFAEVFKYYYLLFFPVRLLNLDRVVITTESHPVARFARIAGSK
jgi:Glycosyl hydrolase family 47